MAGDDIAALAATIRGSDRRLGSILEPILAWGEANRDATERAFRDASLYGAYRALATSAAKAIPGQPTSRLNGTEVSSIADWLESTAGNETGDVRALAVRCLAKAFDLPGWAACFISWIGSAGPVELGAGQIFPRLSPYKTLKEMYPNKLGTAPSTLASSADLRYFALLPALPYALRLRIHGGWDILDNIGSDTTVGAALPWCFHDLAIKYRDSERFFGVFPVATKKRELPLEEAVALADGAAHIVLLPEVVAEPDICTQIGDALSAKSVLIGVAGSSHEEIEGKRRNVARIVGRGGLRSEQAKIVGMKFEGLLEDIEPKNPVLELFVGSQWSMLVLICRDFLDEHIAKVAELLRPGLVLVPSCSPRTSDFDSRVAQLTAVQAHVLVANTCAPASGAGDGLADPSVIVRGRPTTEALEIRVTRTPRSMIQPPHRQIFGLRES